MSNTPSRINPIILACVIALCVIACTFTLLLPGDSLIVDLIYQGF
jgi:hypothetical protein